MVGRVRPCPRHRFRADDEDHQEPPHGHRQRRAQPHDGARRHEHQTVVEHDVRRRQRVGLTRDRVRGRIEARRREARQPVEALRLSREDRRALGVSGGVDRANRVEVGKERHNGADDPRHDQRPPLRESLGPLAEEALEEHRGGRAGRKLEALAVDHVALHRDRHEDAERRDTEDPRAEDVPPHLDPRGFASVTESRSIAGTAETRRDVVE